jgi:DNA processing protein
VDAPVPGPLLRQSKPAHVPAGESCQEADYEEGERATVLDLLSPAPVPVDEIIRQSGISPALVHGVARLEIAGRLERHAGGQVSLAG